MRLDVVPDNYAHKTPDLVSYCVEFLTRFKVIELDKNSVVEMPRFC